MAAKSNASRSAPGPVHRAFALLQTIVAADAPLGVRELARRSGLPRSTVGRTVGILEETGMVSRDLEGFVVPGSALATLTRANGHATPLLRDQFRPLLRELVERFGESSALGLDDGDAFLYLSIERGPGPVQVADSTWQRYAFHVVAAGIMSMAYWDAARLAGYLETNIEPATEHSVIDPKRIVKRLGRARADGFVWTDQELDLEINGLAAPIVDSRGALVAVMSIYGPAYRFSETVSPGLGAELRDLVATRAATLLHD